MSLFSEQAQPAEPQWLADARRRNAPYAAIADNDFSPAVLDRRALLKAHDELAARLSTVEAANAELRELRGKVTSLLEDLANGCVPGGDESDPITGQCWHGVNQERARTLKYAELKCKELGIEWPIKPIPYASNQPSEPAAPPLEEAVPAAALSCWCQQCRNAYAEALPGMERFRFHGSQMVVCPDCGNKRCPKANFHGNACTNSNEVGQPGSGWENVRPAAALPTTGEGKEVAGV